jgi:O-antigen/teichoic acid export membrane protein
MYLLRTLKNFTFIGFGTSFARGFALVNSLIIARVLGPSIFGIFSIFYAVMILSWQLPQAFDGVFVSMAKKTDIKADKIQYLKSAIALKFLYVLTLITLSYPLAFFIGNYCFGKQNLNLPLIYAFLCGSFLTFLLTIASTYQEEERYVLFASIHSVYTSAVFIGLVLLLITKIQFTLNTIFFIYVAISILIGLFSIKFLLKKTGSLLHINRPILLKSFGEGKWVFFANVMFCIYVRLDVLFLPRYVSYESLGQYAVAATLISVVTLALGPLAGVSLPRASLAIRSKEAFNSFVKESLFAVLLIEFGIVLFFMLASHIVILFYGIQYLISVKILRILLVGWMFGAIFVPFQFLFIALEDSRTRFYIELVKFFIAFFLLYILVPSYGITGAAYAITVTLFLGSIISFFLLKLRLKTTFKELCLVNVS